MDAIVQSRLDELEHPSIQEELSIRLFPFEPDWVSETRILEGVTKLQAREVALSQSPNRLVQLIFDLGEYTSAPDDVRLAIAAAQDALNMPREA